VQGCGFWQGAPGTEAELAGVAAELAQVAAGSGNGERTTWLGIREGDGKRTPATEILDEYLVSAMLRAGVHLVLPDSAAAEEWDKDQVVPEDLGRPGVASSAAFGRAEMAPPWIYLRLFLVEGETSRVLAAATRRLGGGHVWKQVAQRRRQAERPEVEVPLEVELHLLGIRSEGGMTRPVAIEEGAVLQSGDRLQVRFKAAADCEVYAFLFRADGVREEVFGSRLVYAGRWEYGPRRGQWINLNEGDQVYTLYFLAGKRLLEDREELWERMEELVEQRQVDRFSGLELLDQTLAEFLLQGIQNQDIEVRRGEIGAGKEENFILEDGTPLKSRAEELKGEPVLVRGVSFAVQ